MFEVHSENRLDPSSTIRAEVIPLVCYGRGLKPTPISLLMRSRKVMVEVGGGHHPLSLLEDFSPLSRTNGDVPKFVLFFVVQYSLFCVSTDGTVSTFPGEFCAKKMATL